MKKIILLSALLSTIFLSSCTTQKAVTPYGSEAHSGAYDVVPGWEKELTTGAKLSPLAIGAGAALYGYFGREPITYEGKEWSQGLTSALYGLAALALSNALISQLDSSGKKGKKYHPSQSQEWIANFNQKRNAPYTITGSESDYQLRIVPIIYLEEYENYEKILAKRRQKNREFWIKAEPYIWVGVGFLAATYLNSLYGGDSTTQPTNPYLDQEELELKQKAKDNDEWRILLERDKYRQKKKND